MRMEGVSTRSIWVCEDGWSVGLFDQTRLPLEIHRLRVQTLEQAAYAIESMQTRGAPMIGVCAVYGVALAMREDSGDQALEAAYDRLLKTRPTAVNLQRELEAIYTHLRPVAPSERVRAAYAWAADLCERDVEVCRRIGEHGFSLIEELWNRVRRPIHILTHCNAGWLACVDWGTALAPIYRAHDHGLPVHVWVSETRPRLQGALTAFELGSHGVPHTVLTDHAAGHLCQQNQVDLVFVGADRVARNGDTANKIGTYLKALLAKTHGIPFYVALPGSTIDWTLEKGVGAIPIEERSALEVTQCCGKGEFFPPGTSVYNPGFDVTPHSFVTGFITERGICAAHKAGLESLYPDFSVK